LLEVSRMLVDIEGALLIELGRLLVLKSAVELFLNSVLSDADVLLKPAFLLSLFSLAYTRLS
jgi:hypothetical protein